MDSKLWFLLLSSRVPPGRGNSSNNRAASESDYAASVGRATATRVYRGLFSEITHGSKLDITTSSTSLGTTQTTAIVRFKNDFHFIAVYLKIKKIFLNSITYLLLCT